MKRLFITLTAAWAFIMSASALSFGTARDQAFFLTDKMAYELDLTDDQYNAAYEINLDYFMAIDSYYDLYGTAWSRRNTEMGYVLSRLQYRTFESISYFYRPVAWQSNKFTFVIYTKYSNKNHFYRSAPSGYQNYKGGNKYYDHSPYQGRTFGNTDKNKPIVPPGGGQQPGGVKPGGQQPGGSTNVGGIAKPGNSGGNKAVGGGSASQGRTPITKKQAINEGKNRDQNRRK